MSPNHTEQPHIVTKVKEIYLVGVDHSETTDHVSAKKRAHDYKKIEIKESAAFLSASKYENKNLKVNVEQNVLLEGRKNLISRCISNLIDNSTK